MKLIGLDVGTSGCKACVFDEAGKLLGYAYKEYDIITTAPLMAEQDAEDVFRKTSEVLGKAVAESGAEDIKALSLSVQGDAIIPVDKDWNAVGPANLGMDYRSQGQAEKMAEKLGEKELFRKTGMRPHPINSLVKLQWMREEMPDVFKKASHITTYADFILAKLGAERVIDETMASRTMGYDLEDRCWAEDILSAFDIDPGLLCDVKPSGENVGTIRSELANKLGLPADLGLVTGGHDQTCAALGAGVIGPGIGVVSTGTAEVFSTVSESPLLSDAIYEAFYPCYRYVMPELYFTFALNHVGGLLLRWVRDNFAVDLAARAREEGKDAYSLMMDVMPDKPTKVLILPHFNGSGTPSCDTGSKGAIVGLTLSHSRADIIRAVLESQTYELKINVEALESAGLDLSEIRAVGGGAKSPQWLQIKADILGRPVRRLVQQEAACLGAALLAGTASKVFTDTEEAVEAAVKIERDFAPERKREKKYAGLYQTYLDLYPRIRPLYDRL